MNVSSGPPPNIGLQRTSACGLAAEAGSLGRRAILCITTLGVLCLTLFLPGCVSAPRAASGSPRSGNQIDRERFKRLDELLRTAHSSLHSVPLVPAEASAALRAVTSEIEAVASFERTEDEKWYGNAVFIAAAMASGEVYAAQKGQRNSSESNVSLIDCFFSAPEGCFSDQRPCGPIEADTQCVKRASK